MGDGYLMVETGGKAAAGVKPVTENPTVLRFHVFDLKAAVETLRTARIPVEVLRFDWGVIGAFCDLDGNPCEIAEAWTALGSV